MKFTNQGSSLQIESYSLTTLVNCSTSCCSKASTTLWNIVYHHNCVSQIVWWEKPFKLCGSETKYVFWEVGLKNIWTTHENKRKHIILPLLICILCCLRKQGIVLHISAQRVERSERRCKGDRWRLWRTVPWPRTWEAGSPARLPPPARRSWWPSRTAPGLPSTPPPSTCTCWRCCATPRLGSTPQLVHNVA